MAISIILSAKKGISSLQLSRTIGVNKNTAWFMQMRLRKAMKEDATLGGLIEVDNNYTRGSTGKMSKKIKKKYPGKAGLTHKVRDSGLNEPNGKRVNQFRPHLKLDHKMRQLKWGRRNLSSMRAFYSTLKRAVVGQYHKLSYQHLPSYMDEIDFKYTNSSKDMFDLLLIRCLRYRANS
jgi:hypothetical protein